ncbi:MAG: reverse transcriptase family protein, partial [Gaiellaceae bacterium]
MPCFDVILGMDWMRPRAAALFASGDLAATFKHEGQVYNIPAVDSADSEQSASEQGTGKAQQPIQFMSAMAFSKTVKLQEVHMYIVRMITSFDEDGCIMAAVTEDAIPLQQNNTPVTDPRVEKLKAQYPDVLCTEQPKGLPPQRPTVPTIPLTNENLTVFQQMYRLSPVEKSELEAQLKDLLQRGLIRPSTSPFGSPILFVKKKDGSMRMVVDYRQLNKLTVKNRYPLPRIDDLFDRLHGAQFFSSLDLMSGYHQIRLHESDVPKTAFRTPAGLYEFLVMPFGLTNAPATFQTEMNKLLGHLPFVAVYLDDILIHSKSEQEHEEHLHQVLEILREAQLIVKFKKCSFYKQELPFLGHIISAEGVKVDPAKTKVVDEWPAPQNTHQLQQFLGLSNYFRQY